MRLSEINIDDCAVTVMLLLPMGKIARHISALICLVALLCGGHLSACACEIAAPPAACEGHDHSSHDSHSENSAPGDDAGCPCATCHSCPHAQIILAVVLIPMAPTDGAGFISDKSVSLIIRSSDIFTPPKLV